MRVSWILMPGILVFPDEMGKSQALEEGKVDVYI